MTIWILNEAEPPRRRRPGHQQAPDPRTCRMCADPLFGEPPRTQYCKKCADKKKREQDDARNKELVDAPQKVPRSKTKEQRREYDLRGYNRLKNDPERWDARKKKNREWKKKWREENPDKWAEKSKKYNEERRKSLSDVVLGRICRSCGLTDKEIKSFGNVFGSSLTLCTKCESRMRRYGKCTSGVHAAPPKIDILTWKGPPKQPKSSWPHCKCSSTKVDPDYLADSNNREAEIGAPDRLAPRIYPEDRDIPEYGYETIQKRKLKALERSTSGQGIEAGRKAVEKEEKKRQGKFVPGISDTGRKGAGRNTPRRSTRGGSPFDIGPRKPGDLTNSLIVNLLNGGSAKDLIEADRDERRLERQNDPVSYTRSVMAKLRHRNNIGALSKVEWMKLIEGTRELGLNIYVVADGSGSLGSYLSHFVYVIKVDNSLDFSQFLEDLDEFFGDYTRLVTSRNGNRIRYDITTWSRRWYLRNTLNSFYTGSNSGESRLILIPEDLHKSRAHADEIVKLLKIQDHPVVRGNP